MKVTFELTTEEFKELFGVSVVNNVVCELKETESDLQPNWDNAPEWATCWAVDEDGKAHWYNSSDIETEDGQWVFSIESEDYSEFEVDKDVSFKGTDWKTTLRKRPQ